MKDPSVSDLHRTHCILDSLLPPAAEMIKHLGPQAQPSAYLAILEYLHMVPSKTAMNSLLSS